MKTINTPTFTANYPTVFRARKNDLNGKLEFSVTAIFKKGEDLSVLTKFVQETIGAKWGTDKAKWPKNLRLPFRKHEERAKDHPEKPGVMVYPAGFEAGGIFLTLKSTRQPGLVDGRKGNAQILDESEIYSGCLMKAAVSCYAYDNAGNRGVSLGLVHLQKVGDSTPLAGATKAEDAFAPIAATEGASALDAFM
jgi:hypothetical protein